MTALASANAWFAARGWQPFEFQRDVWAAMASSRLFYEVFRKYDAGNLLLSQAETEVLAQELELKRLAATLKKCAKLRLDVVDLQVPSPFSLPLMVERFREQLTTEKVKDRLDRILQDAERALAAAAQPMSPPPRRQRRTTA